MAGFGSNVKLEASSVTKGDILKLKEADYLPASIAHWAPEEGQIIPMPQSGERVVLFPIFLEG